MHAETFYKNFSLSVSSMGSITRQEQAPLYLNLIEVSINLLAAQIESITNLHSSCAEKFLVEQFFRKVIL